jgi:hypothetical protein
VIWEAFKPESEPKRTATRYAVMSWEDRRQALLEQLRQGKRLAQRPPTRRADPEPRLEEESLSSEDGIY